MRNFSLLLLLLTLAPHPLQAARKPHTVAFGKWQTIKLLDDATPKDLKIRPLYVDEKLKEFTTGAPHEITDHLFVVRRAYRVNDSLPAEESKPLRWRWQLGGWLQVDRTTGRVSALNLPDFDPAYSTVAWYRDYAAYCGVSDDGKKLYAIVIQLARRKPVLKKPAGQSADGGPEANCPPPEWERQPVRVTFDPKQDDPATFSVRGHSADLIPEESEEETPSK